jgi:hypothetical protein
MLVNLAEEVFLSKVIALAWIWLNLSETYIEIWLPFWQYLGSEPF